MNRKLIYFSLLTLVSSYGVLSFILGFLVNGSSREFIGNYFLVIQVLCSILLPILLALLAKYWKIEFNKAILYYGVTLFVALIVLLIRIYLSFDQFSVSIALVNGVVSWALPVIVFLLSYKIIKKQ